MNTIAIPKPLGRKAYGSIPHLPGSRLGEGDHHCHDGQRRIACEKARDKHDLIMVHEKLDGSCTSVANVNGEIVALGRAGYLAQSSPHKQHVLFAEWVGLNRSRFTAFLNEGERVCGEWMVQAHGTRYALPHEPWVVFDLFREEKRVTVDELQSRMGGLGFVFPRLIHRGCPFSIEECLKVLEPSGHGAIDSVEGAVWRVERKSQFDFLCKYVRPDKVDGLYMKADPLVWNTYA